MTIKFPSLVAPILAFVSASHAIYMPIYLPPTSSYAEVSYALEKVDVTTHTLHKGWDTLVHPGDTLGLVVASPILAVDIDYRVDAKGWRDSFPDGFRKFLTGIRPQGSIVDVEASPVSDTLPLDVQVWKGGGRTSSTSDTIGALRQIVLVRPNSVPGLGAVLVVSERIRSRKILPAGTSNSTALDVLLGWGLWDPASSRWVAWGMTPLRSTKSDIGVLDASEVADRLVRAVVDEAEIPSGVSGVRSAEKKSKFGGLLLGFSLQAGFHTSGDLYRMAKASSSDNSVTRGQFIAQVAWYSDWWGVAASLPFVDGTSMENNSRDAYGTTNSQSVSLFDGFSPSVEFVSFVPVKGMALTAGVGVGHMSLTGQSEGWMGAPPSGKGWFWYPCIGAYFPWKYVYMGTDLGLEFQSYDLSGTSAKSTLFFFDLRFGLRLAHGS